MGKLTALKIRTLTTVGRYGDGGGLWLQVRDADHRSWLFRYMRHGKARQMGLGPLGDVSLAEARQAAQDCRQLLLNDQDPLEQRQRDRVTRAEQAGANTFREVAGRYLAAHGSTWRNVKHRAQWRATLEAYAFPIFGDRPCAAVQTGDVLKALEPIWREKPETAARLRGRVESVLEYASARGWRQGDNPARWRGHLANLLPARGKVAKVEHHAALPWAEIPAFLTDLRTEVGMAARALEFAILTAARTGEVIGAKWSEIDLAAGMWTVPEGRMKAGREHRVPLPAPALAVLRQVGKAGAKVDAFVFPGGAAKKHLSNMAMPMLLRRMKRPEITVHGFRSTFRDWAAEATDYPRELAEAALAHTLKDKVEAAYRRSDLFAKRAEMMEEWGRWCQPTSPEKATGPDAG